jgi:hypothetical protein
MRDMKTWRDCWLAFWAGAIHPSLASLVIAFSVNVLVFVALCVYITPDFLAGPMHRYLMKDPFDSFVPLTAKALLSRHSEPPQIVILGDSVTVRCVSNEERLAGMVAEKSRGSAPIVYDLSADGVVLLEMEVLAEQLPTRFDGILILGVAPPVLSNPMRDLVTDILNTARMGLSSEVIDNAARSVGVKVPYRTGVYFIDNWRFFLSRVLFTTRNLLITGAQPYVDPLDHPWVQEIKRSEQRQREMAEKYFSLVTRLYEPNKQANLAVIERIITGLKKRGDVSFILLQAPINPLWYDNPIGKEFFEKYTADLRQFATEHGMSFLSPSQEAKLRPADFFDHAGHIGNHEARERCTQAIASQVAKIMTTKAVSLQLPEAANPLQR